MKNWFVEPFEDILQKYILQVSEKMYLSKEFTSLLLKRLYKQDPNLFYQTDTHTLLAHIDRFLNPSLQKLLHPTFLPDVEKAGTLILEALQRNEKILVWGDYDVDGITASTLCVEVFKRHGYDVLVHLPQREQGYGLNKDVLKQYIDQGIKLILTVDCGISDKEAIAFAREQNVRIIVSDHHIPPDDLPCADALINPCLCVESDVYMKKDIALAGVGVAFFLMCHVNNILAHETGIKCDMRDFLDIVALGTIADMVPLVGLNRILVKNGLVKIAEAKRIGLQALKEVSGYSMGSTLTAGQVSFGLAPRINAAGRMADPHMALDLLLAQEYTVALKLAEQLDSWNSQRKKEEEAIVQEALQQAEMYDKDSVLVLNSRDWNQGIIGIVASRMIEKFYKPTFILTQSQNSTDFKGSGRSTSEIDIHEALCACSDELLSFGGHKKAAGLKISADKIASFREKFNAFVYEKLGKVACLPTIHIDEEVDFVHASDSTFLQEISMLEPFGIGNPEPTFCTYNVRLKSVQRFGFGGKHLKLELFDVDSRQLLHAKLWNTKDFEFIEGSLLQVAYTTSLDEYRGMKQVNMRLKDCKLVR